jgi:hypothetical protein
LGSLTACCARWRRVRSSDNRSALSRSPRLVDLNSKRKRGSPELILTLVRAARARASLKLGGVTDAIDPSAYLVLQRPRDSDAVLTFKRIPAR